MVESNVPLSESSMLLHKEEEEEKTLREKHSAFAGPNNDVQLTQLLNGISSMFNTVDGAHINVQPPPRVHNAKFSALKPASLRSGR